MMEKENIELLADLALAFQAAKEKIKILMVMTGDLGKPDIIVSSDWFTQTFSSYKRTKNIDSSHDKLYIEIPGGTASCVVNATQKKETK